MRDQRYGRGTEPLTPVECARLRPTVDIAALARLIDAMGGEGRRALIAYFAEEPTIADLREVLLEAGAPEQAAALDDALAVEEELRLDESTRAGLSPRRAFLPPQPGDLVIEFKPPDDERLRALWTAVEPDGPFSPNRDRTG